MPSGTLYGIGVGPGDPELLTLKALRLLRAAAIVAYPAPEDGDSFARGIVAQWLAPHQQEIPIRFPMRPGTPPATIYDAAAAALGGALDTGGDVAFLCQGDPLIYGSFIPVLARLSAHYRVTIVPGVSSLSACAAAGLWPLATRDATLAVIPATLEPEELARRIAGTDAAAIIKLGRHFAKLRAVLERLDLLDRALYVERATLASQRVMPLCDVDPRTVPYFAMALVRCTGRFTGSGRSV